MANELQRLQRAGPGCSCSGSTAGDSVALSEPYLKPVEELTLEDWLTREVELVEVEEETPLLE